MPSRANLKPADPIGTLLATHKGMTYTIQDILKRCHFDRETKCWVWDGYRHPNGYGMHTLGYVHRVVWTLLKGDIPEGMECHHKCKNRSCCSPAHLELIDHTEHMRRHPPSLYCKRGHPRTPENLYGRVCKPCQLAKSRARRNNIASV